MTKDEHTVACRGIVAYSEHDWRLEDMFTREPHEDEFLIEVVATGVCHTDITGYGGIYPRVLGHEGELFTYERMDGSSIARVKQREG